MIVIIFYYKIKKLIEFNIYGVGDSPERGVIKETAIDFETNFFWKIILRWLSIKFGVSFVKALSNTWMLIIRTFLIIKV